MKNAQMLDTLIEILLAEQHRYKEIAIPDSIDEKRALYRALVNVRSPRPIAENFLKIQDEFLQEEARQKGIVKLEDIPPCPISDRISLWQGDITRLAIDAIVNAANREMLGCFAPGHNCIDNAIHTAAGVQLREKCHEIMQEQGHDEQTANAKITGGFNLPTKYVIHTVGPIVKDNPTKTQEKELARCYLSCLDLAISHGIQSIAFCCISTGVFAFPKRLAAEIAVNTVYSHLKEHEQTKRVIFNVFTDEDFSLYKDLLYT